MMGKVKIGVIGVGAMDSFSQGFSTKWRPSS